MVWYILNNGNYAGIVFGAPSPDPKPVIMLPGGPKPGIIVAWDFEGDPITGYFAKIGGDPTAPGAGLLESEIFASQHREMKWQIKAHLSDNGVTRYVIQGQGSEKVWVASKNPGEPIRYLDVFDLGVKENYFPPEALFELKWE
ncbi:hypothetical protein GYMLUDRAFT_38274 [Collybiopsis luxurians FD-317 M1]|nr:hypothetical protein GYMLUDRAFT_38274 [Collybiopsis luxurians FD-317 M1]